MAIERRVITHPDAVSQRILLPKVTTTNATPVTIYTSQAVPGELRRVYIRCVILVSTPTASAVSSIIAEGTYARATGETLRLADSNFARTSGEIKANQASVVLTVVAGRFVVNVVGSTGNAYEWSAMIDLFRNN